MLQFIKNILVLWTTPINANIFNITKMTTVRPATVTTKLWPDLGLALDNVLEKLEEQTETVVEVLQQYNTILRNTTQYNQGSYKKLKVIFKNNQEDLGIYNTERLWYVIYPYKCKLAKKNQTRSI